MKYRLCTVALLAMPLVTAIGAEDAPPVDVNSVLTTLQTIQKKSDTGSKADKMDLANQYLSMAGDSGAAQAYYEAAVRAVKFDGESQESMRFQDWKKAEADHMRTAAFRDGLSLHLRYLSLTMRRSAGVEVKDLLPDLLAYTAQVALELDSAGGQSAVFNNPFAKQGRRGPSDQRLQNIAQTLTDPRATPPSLDDQWMKQPISASIFVVWKQVQDYVTVDGWAQSPGDVDGIYEQTILPEFRRVKDPRLLEYWDMKMARDEQTASKTGRSFDITKFEQTDKPVLMWSRAQELLVLNMRNRAINDMLTIIKTYPTHPNIKDWISQVESLVKPAAPAAVPASTGGTAGGSAPQGAVPPAQPQG